jgi:hypothetical protein
MSSRSEDADRAIVEPLPLAVKADADASEQVPVGACSDKSVSAGLVF